MDSSVQLKSSELVRISKKTDFKIDDYYYIVVFPKTRSSAYPILIETMKNIMCKDIENGAYLHHIVGLTKNKSDLIKLKLILDLLSGIRNVLFFVDGQKKNIWQHIRIIECCIAASQCNDYRAHCWRTDDVVANNYLQVFDAPSFGRKRVIIKHKITLYPCSKMNYLIPRNCPPGIEKKDMYQAFAVQNELNTCPFFILNDFKYEERGDEKWV